MRNWVQIDGIVQAGYGVASGKSSDVRFPQGTLALQKPLFADQGLNLDHYFLGTINVSIYPHQYIIKRSKYTFRNVNWAVNEPAEDFSFFDCRITLDHGTPIEGLIYYPHPETKPEHFQAPEVLEIMTPWIQNLNYGDHVILEVDRTQIDILISNG
jgi:hypothetical protein